ncbi:DUF3987 domain-containing protein [Rufibacter glacialis]|uniref:DUF3987 domain-containing protein n=1 Tax=Rufibacter glacialis TaxID=1259555 RepID=A0A5M8QHE2_9BACT|nr:DUF3987 domain-containing protein [Rufibacter glacialis]KAA6435497.1 DUF3987 domain-containing protein [Rufibacter glacialis]GGK64052.1 hypothetical protein GCM10011405_10010 [Rufibacter glacialis]
MHSSFNLQQFLSATAVKAHVEFPVEAFPAPLQKIIKDLWDYLLYPVDFTGSSLLMAMGVAVGNALKVQVKKGWLESTLLYMALVGRPGTAKSHPLSFALSPLHKRDRGLYLTHREEMKEYKRELAQHKKDKGGMPPPDKPIVSKSVIQDSTPEALLEVLQNNPRGLVLYMDELMGYLNNFNRYSQGSEQEMWLTIWSQKHLIQDRKSGEPINIPSPFVAVVGTIQDGMLESMAKGGRSVNGFLDRFLFAKPKNLEKAYWSQVEIDSSVEEEWEKYMDNLFEIPMELNEEGSPSPKVLLYSPAGHALLSEWQRYNTDLVNSAPTDSLAGMYVKMETQCIRLSLVLQAAIWATCEGDLDRVGTQAVQGAIMLTEYFRRTGTEVNDIITNYSPLDSLPEDRRRYYESLPNEFSKAEALNLALDHGIKPRTLADFLNKATLFRNTGHGKYIKLI